MEGTMEGIAAIFRGRGRGALVKSSSNGVVLGSSSVHDSAMGHHPLLATYENKGNCKT